MDHSHMASSTLAPEGVTAQKSGEQPSLEVPDLRVEKGPQYIVPVTKEPSKELMAIEQTQSSVWMLARTA